ncbi:MAG: DUF4178 domain-containing protein [Cellvibrio sp.]
MVTDVKNAVRNTACASCGAQVPIYSRASVQAVCPFCRSTLVRTDMDWNSVGEMAALADDLSPFYLGMRGKYKQVNFTVIGRLQQQFDQGVWNEWLLQLDNRRTSWLGEGSGLFYLTVPSTSTEVLPEFNNLSLGQQVLLDGKSYSVSNIETACCVATEGEIPFAATPGESSHFVDLVGEEGAFASLDYSDEVPKLYTGKTINLDELEFETRDGKPLKQQATEALRCSGCGNAVTLRNPASLLVTCSSCGAANNVSASGKLVIAYSQSIEKLRLDLPLGSTGVLQGYSYEVIGFMRLSSDGDSWDEYLLYNPSQGVSWLVCAQGHWSFVWATSAPANVVADITFSFIHKSKKFKHFAGYKAKVVAVLGEFYWQVKCGDTAECNDFIYPPYIMSSEKSAKEIVWSEGTYIEGSQIATAFNINEVKQKGDGINQPSPNAFGYIAAFLISMALVVLVDMFVHPRPQTITFNSLDIANNTSTSELTSDPFEIKAPHSFFRIYANSNLRNDWAALEYRLTNQTTGETRIMNREVSYYYGSDSDGAWSEGSPGDEAVLDNVLAGTYVLEVSGETEARARPDIKINIQATHGEASSANFWLIFFVLAIGPILAGIRKYLFERRRWDNSDHPWSDE